MSKLPLFSAVNNFSLILPNLDCTPLCILNLWLGQDLFFLIAVYMWVSQTGVKEPLQFPLYNHAPHALCTLFVCEQLADFKGQNISSSSVLDSVEKKIAKHNLLP